MKKSLKILIVILFVFLLSLITFDYVSKNILVETISDTYTKKRVTGNIVNQLKKIDNIDSITFHKLNKELKNSKEINKISHIYLDSIIKSVVTGNASVDITKNIENMINKSKNLTSDQKSKLLQNREEMNLDSVYYIGEYTVKNSIDKTKKTLLHIYYILDKLLTKILVIALTIGLIIYVFINDSECIRYKLYCIASFIISFILFISRIVIGERKLIVHNKFVDIEHVINLSLINKVALIYLIVAIILLIFHIIKNKKRKKM